MPNGSYFLTRQEDLAAVYGDAPLYELHINSLLFNDAPRHTRVSKFIMGALTRRAIDAMETGLIELVDGLLDKLEDQQKAI